MTADALREVLTGPVDEVAPLLLGAVVRKGPVAVRLTEVEAYGGGDDPGSHAFRGPTPRNRVMFGPPGVLYAYLSYGMHVCANVSTGPAGSASAVLLRAGVVVDGLDVVAGRRPGVDGPRLARGPALLTRCLGIELADDGADLGDADGVTLSGPFGSVAAEERRSGPRVGLRGAPDRPWRHWTADEASVSTYRRHPRLDPPPSGC